MLPTASCGASRPEPSPASPGPTKQIYGLQESDCKASGKHPKSDSIS